MATSNDNQNIWFGVSMGLMGLIVGFVVATFMNGSVMLQPAQQQPAAKAPSAPAAVQSSPAAAPQAQAANTVVPFDPKIDHIRGNPNAKLLLIEYSDYECPFCARVHPTIKQILEKYPNDVAWVFRDFPLSFHPKAMPAAIASECIAKLAGEDAFWKFTDTIYEEQNFDYVSIAKDLGVNEAKFKDCTTNSADIVAKINQEEKEGSMSGVTGTPGNILYNPKTKESRLIPGARPLEMFQNDIDAMLKNAK